MMLGYGCPTRPWHPVRSVFPLRRRWPRQFIKLALTLFLAVAPAARGNHVVLVTPGGSAFAWGDNQYGQVRRGEPERIRKPLRLIPESGWRMAATGTRHSIGIDEKSVTWVWGDNSAGQSGMGHTKPLASPARLELGHVVAVSAGTQHSLTLDAAGQVKAWGGNGFGQTGNGKTGAAEIVLTPSLVQGLPEIIGIAAWRHSSAALGRDGSVWVWGLGAAANPRRLDGVQKAERIRSDGTVLLISDGPRFWKWSPAQHLEAATSTEFQRTPDPLMDGVAILSGTVRKEGKSIPGVAVSIDQELCGVTIADGRFICPTSAGAHKVSFRADTVSIPPMSATFLSGHHDVSPTLATTTFRITGRFEHAAPAAMSAAPGNHRCTINARSHSYLCVVPSGWSGTISVRRDSKVIETRTIRKITKHLTNEHFMPRITSPVPKPAAAPTVPPAPVPAKPIVTERSAAAVPSNKEPDGSLAPSAPASRDPEIRDPRVNISGYVYIGVATGTASPRLSGVSIVGNGAICPPTDPEGRFRCSVPRGWSGRLEASRAQYVFSPRSMIFSNVANDIAGQNFSATFEPR